MSIPPQVAESDSSSLASIMRTTLSYDTNIMLAAIISLLLVILFVLFLHLYTRWFLLQARRRSRSSSVTAPRVLRSRLHQRRFTMIIDHDNDNDDDDHYRKLKGLPFSIISSLPLFIYKCPSIIIGEELLECSICLSIFEEDEIGRKLPGCGHAFHVECIDMWLHSHSTCPICRAPIRSSRKIDDQLEMQVTDLQVNSSGLAINNHHQEEEELRLEINATTISNQIQNNDSAIGEESQSQIIPSCSCSCSSRSGGKVHPASSIVNGGQSEA